jgi:probable phosphoglycerate mutase
MGPRAVITSDLRRARQTAAAVSAACGAPVRVDPALREVDLGGWEGLDDETAARRFPVEHASWRRGEDVRRGGGETLAEAGERVAAAILAAAGECPPGGVVVVVSHGLVLRHACQLPHLANGAWAALAFPAGAYTLRSSTPDALAVGR